MPTMKYALEKGQPKRLGISLRAYVRLDSEPLQEVRTQVLCADLYH